MEDELENPAADAGQDFPDDVDSCCSTPFVSAPSSPGRGTPLAGYYYSAPTSPMHFILSTANLKSYPSAASAADASSSFDFDFSTTLPSSGAASPESMTSADELFFNGQIRPMKLSAHLKRPQLLAPLIELDDSVEPDPPIFTRGREMKLRNGSVTRRTRSMSPMRKTTSFHWNDDEDEKPKEETENSASGNEIQGEEEKGSDETTPCASRSSSAGRSSKRWVFLKEFLYRSKSEGRNEGHKFWSGLSFSPAKDKKTPNPKPAAKPPEIKKRAVYRNGGGGKRRGVASAHELHYTANRAQAEEMRKRTFLPYRQGLLGCLGFSSKSYGAMNGFAKALNPVSSR